jgi:magnesium-transporting ATPase (P-type)
MNDENGYAYTIVRPSDKNLPQDKETHELYCENNVEIKIFKQFEFQSKLQRMSVLCIDQEHKQFRVYMKGDPLTISKFCIPETIPQDYMKEIKEYQ